VVGLELQLVSERLEELGGAPPVVGLDEHRLDALGRHGHASLRRRRGPRLPLAGWSRYVRSASATSAEREDPVSMARYLTCLIRPTGRYTLNCLTSPSAPPR